MNNEEMKVVGMKERKEDKGVALKLIEDLTSKCDEMQGQVLADILSQNAEVEYLKRHGIHKGCIDRETFKTKVPVVTYEDLKPDIQRIVNGDLSPILFARPISQFYSSTGTSGGEPRLIPATDEDMPRRFKLNHLLNLVITEQFEGLDSGKILGFYFTREESKTPSGITVGGIVPSYMKAHFKLTNPSNPSIFTSPKEVALCTDHFQSMYTQMLCGLYQRHEVVRITTPFASTLVTILGFLRNHYLELCQDISSAKLNLAIKDPSLRAHMVEHVMKQADPELAEFINHACKEENWQGILEKIWPNAKCVETILTGTMVHYIPMLKYYSGGIPLVSNKYESSECFYGININPTCDPYEVSYTLLPNNAYFEFLPLKPSSGDHSQPQLVDLADVEVGHEYELVVTTYNGLYRYRVEDVVSPTGFYNSTPQFKFLRRSNVVLSLHVEKTSELELQKAIQKASDVLLPLGATIVEYTSYANLDTIPGNYVIYCELSTSDATTMNEATQEVMKLCCLAIENSLNYYYRCYRVYDHSIGPLNIRVVKNGTFDKLRSYAISRGASFGQYKVPRCVKLVPMLELLDSGVISSHTSPSLPDWDATEQVIYDYCTCYFMQGMLKLRIKSHYFVYLLPVCCPWAGTKSENKVIKRKFSMVVYKIVDQLLKLMKVKQI